MCRVQTDRSIQNCTRLALPGEHSGFDVQLADNGIRLAAALRDNRSVALFRVDAERHVQLLSNASVPGAHFPLFCGDTLLVAVVDRLISETVSFSIRQDRLIRDRLLISRGEQHPILHWWFVNETLFVLRLSQ